MKAYLAGPDVFLADRDDRRDNLMALCSQYGATGVWPGDIASDVPLDIYKNCITGIEMSDIVIANISPFRGVGMDAGTAFEIGYARARNIPVFAYTESGIDLYWRVLGSMTLASPQDEIVEDFGYPENLMIVHGCEGYYSNAENALAAGIQYVIERSQRFQSITL